METRSLCGLLDGLVGHCICFGVDGTSCVGVVVVSPAGFELDWWDVAGGFEEPFGVPPVHPGGWPVQRSSTVRHGPDMVISSDL